MVYYLKINRKEEYIFPNLQNWVDVIFGIPDSKIFIICDDIELEKKVRERIAGEKQLVFIESERKDPEVRHIIKGFSSERWENAGYAHITTFFHARANGYKSFWNIDADDTFFCLSKERIRELLAKAEEVAVNNSYSLLSLDMWYSKSRVNHWTFGISYTDNTVDWFAMMKEHLEDSDYKSANHPPNMDGYFTYLRGLNETKIESFYAENLRFLHYSNDFFRRPWASGFYHWKDGSLVFPVLRDCFKMENLGTVEIPKDVLKIDIGITDEEARDAMVKTCYKADRSDIELRYSEV